jgi:hypothetical protein
VKSRHNHDGVPMHALDSLLTVLPTWTRRTKCNAEFGHARFSPFTSIDSTFTFFHIITFDYISFHRAQCDAACAMGVCRNCALGAIDTTFTDPLFLGSLHFIAPGRGLTCVFREKSRVTDQNRTLCRDMNPKNGQKRGVKWQKTTKNEENSSPVPRAVATGPRFVVPPSGGLSVRCRRARVPRAVATGLTCLVSYSFAPLRLRVRAARRRVQAPVT